MRLTPVALLALAALAISCGGAPDSSGSDAPGPPERLAHAVTELAEANTGRFSSETAALGRTPTSGVDGVYRLSPPAARVTVTRYLDGAAQGTDVLAIGRDAWSRGPQAPCWIHHDVAALFDSGLLVRNGDTYAPAPVAAVAHGRGASSTDADQVSGTTELSTVLAVADLSLPAALGISRSTDHRVPAVFTIDDGVLKGWEVFVRDAIEQARRYDEGATAAGTGVVSGLGGTITTRLTDLGTDVAFEAPPPGEVVEHVAEPDELEQRLAACASQAP